MFHIFLNIYYFRSMFLHPCFLQRQHAITKKLSLVHNKQFIKYLNITYPVGSKDNQALVKSPSILSRTYVHLHRLIYMHMHGLMKVLQNSFPFMVNNMKNAHICGLQDSQIYEIMQLKVVHSLSSS